MPNNWFYAYVTSQDILSISIQNYFINGELKLRYSKKATKIWKLCFDITK